MNNTSGVLSRRQPDSLADVLERVLDKGIVIAGDIVVNVLDIELLSLKLRLFIASAETAREMGMDWWTQDPFFNSRAPVDDADERQQLREQNEQLRRQLTELRETLDRAGIPAAQNQQGEAGP